MNNNKIGSLISSIITLVLAGLDFYIILNLLKNVPTKGLEALAMIAILPILLILSLVCIGLLISTITTSIRAIFSKNIFIKIISIIILIIAIILMISLVIMLTKILKQGG